MTTLPERPSPAAVAEPPRVDRERQVLERVARSGGRAVFRDARVTMAHGAGGKASRNLFEGLFLPLLSSAALDELGDCGIVRLGEGGAGAGPLPGDRPRLGSIGLALTTDSFVVRPLTFPGGSIGALAVNGTLNDLAVAGARPLALTLAMVLEEGLPAKELAREVEAIADCARAAGVAVVAGDTKVVERGHADGLYLTTTGLGILDPRADLSPRAPRPGDRVLVSGSIADHGTAILLARGEFELDGEIESDTRSLWPAVDALLGAAGPHLRVLRDATRGGVASALNELARASGTCIVVRDSGIVVRPAVAGACELLGIDPMYVANEGKLVAFVAPEGADAALQALRRVEGCEDASEIGQVLADPPGLVLVETAFGSRRVLDLLVGDPLPRIC
jgi:hydrogenase expression/formation protein HypE